jgi:hypothetical protein
MQAAGFMFANSMTLDMQLDLSWILCSLGLAGVCALFLNFHLCVSRACLGKFIVF